MGTLDSLILSDAAGIVADQGETISYTPKGGVARDITANIKRFKADAIPGTSRGYAGYADVQLSRHPTTGTTSIIVGGDNFSFPDQIGVTATDHKNGVEIIAQDAGFWYLRIYIS